MKTRYHILFTVIAALFGGVVSFMFLPPIGLFLGINAVVAFLLVAVILLAGIGTLLYNVYRDGPEAFVFADARRNGLPVLEMIDVGSGHGKFFLGERDKDDKINFDTGYAGIQIDPTLTTSETAPTRHPYGLNIFRYGTTHWLPITSKNALAMKTIRAARHDGVFKAMDFLKDEELFQLISTPRDHLEHDCQLFIKRYQPEWPVGMDKELATIGKKAQTGMEATDLQVLIEVFQQKISTMPVQTGFFAFQAGIKDLPFAHAAQDLEHLIMLVKKELFEQFQKKLEWMQYGIIFAVIICASGFAIYIASMAFT